MDRVLDSIVERLGGLEAAYLIGDYAEGRYTGIVILVLVGVIDRHILDDLVAKAERFVERKIRVLVFSDGEFVTMANNGALQPRMELWWSA